MIYRPRLAGVHVATHGHGAHTDVRHPIKEPEVTKEQFDAIMEALAPVVELAAEEARVAAEAAGEKTKVVEPPTQAIGGETNEPAKSSEPQPPSA